MRRLALPRLPRSGLRGARVLVRVDFNVPVDRLGRVTDTLRIEAAIPTIRTLSAAHAVTVLLAHRGRPGGKVVKALALPPVVTALARLLRRTVTYVPEVRGVAVRSAVDRAKPGEVLMLGNLRFERGEDEAAVPFAKELARLGDLFVFDAFGVAHRTTATTWTIKRFLPCFAGLLVQREVAALSRVVDHPKRPTTVIIGGAKISTKLALMRKLLPRVDNLVLGGALANTLLAAQGIQVGRSLIEPGLVRQLRPLALTNPHLHLPLDVIVSKSVARPVGVRRAAAANVRANEAIVDVGPDTVELLGRLARASRSVVWNGPLGVYEVPAFGAATRALARTLARSQAFTVVGGGETLDAIRSQKLGHYFDHLSTGGGAMLAFLEGKTLPGLQLPPNAPRRYTVGHR